METKLTLKQQKRIVDANNFRNMLLAMDGIVKIPAFEDKVEILDFIYKNNYIGIETEEQLKRCLNLLRKNLLIDFKISFMIIGDKVRCISLTNHGEDWRRSCAILNRYKEREQFGYTDIDVDAWLPEGYNF